MHIYQRHGWVAVLILYRIIGLYFYEVNNSMNFEMFYVIQLHHSIYSIITTLAIEFSSNSACNSSTQLHGEYSS